MTLKERLQKLVAENVYAELGDYRLTDHPKGPFGSEMCFVVLWARIDKDNDDRSEFGTHVAVLSDQTDEGMLVWGHYYREPEPAVYDFGLRVAAATGVSR